MTITEFLTARYDEEVGTSVPLSDGSEWRRDMPIWSDLEVAGGDRTVSAEEHSETLRILEHWTARVLADIAAKRAIVDVHSSLVYGKPSDECLVCHQNDEDDQPTYPCTTLRLLASLYVSHKDYDPTWRVG